MTTPTGKDDAELDPDAAPLGSAVAPPDDEDSGGAPSGPASGQAGPSYPPAGSEPDAHR
ncbi:hypothetical protein ACI797_26625 [Geodermatophilus sp. SYSU D00691]